MPLVGGVLFDKLSVRLGLIIFTAVVCVGQGLFMLGGFQMSFTLMLLGRIVFGSGCEAMIVGQSAIISKWFMDFELPFAMSMIICVPLLGTQIGGMVVPSAYNANGFGFAFSLGFMLLLMSLVIVIILALIDRHAEKKDLQLLKEYKRGKDLHSKELEDIIEEEEDVQEDSNGSNVQQTEFKEEFKFSDIKKLNFQYWCTCISCFFMQTSINNYLVVASAVLQTRFGFSDVAAGFLFPMPYMIAAISSPLIGFFVDRFGYRNVVAILGSVVMILGHVIIIVSPDCSMCWNSIPPLVCLGISYACYAVAQWGSLPYLVDHKVLGTAFGICNAFENLATTVAGPILGIIEEKTKEKQHGYFYTEIFFIASAVFALIFNLLALYPLNMTREEKIQRHESISILLRDTSRVSASPMLMISNQSQRMSRAERSFQSERFASNANLKQSRSSTIVGLQKAKYKYSSLRGSKIS